jgi:hypothetical protein
MSPTLRRATLLGGLLALAPAAGCVRWWPASGQRSDDQIQIPHGAHGRAKIACLTCHEEIYDAKSLDETVLPPEKKCLQCHREQKEQGRCAMCHTEPGRAGSYRRAEPALKLSHAAHLDRIAKLPVGSDADGGCVVCHEALPDPLRSERTRPQMSACLSCHEHRKDYDEGRCGTCHVDLRKYQLEPLSTFSHRGDFVREHGAVARTGPDTCAKCHEQTFCTDCHGRTVSTKIEVKLPERVDAQFIHRNDFLGRHAAEAKAEPATCRRCHGSSFCEGCHQAQNLTPFGSNPRDPHPPGWAFPGSADFHGTAARRDIASCAACHDQGARSICVDCHRVGGIGGNPHPPGWDVRHGRNEIARNGMCRACHL